ncbi:MAG: ATP-dependent DNA helicase RecQ [Clostridia bacterium]|nr:ATP-dependent DNA helicase RecQ [Clostridia bacterium]
MASAQKQLEQVLREHFGVSEFRPGQREVIERLLRGQDVAAVFPTGAGKSLCYQLPALMLPGVTLVVSPLISLMRDQVASLSRRGIPAVFLDSLQSPEDRQRQLNLARSGQARLIYAAPERLASEHFRCLIRSLTLSLLVVDEAHCVVQWGESFRPAYAAIGAFIAELPERPVVCAMTATSDPQMLKGIAQSLRVKRFDVLRLPLIRPNLRYSVRTTLNPEKELRRLLSEREGQRGIIFCQTRSRAEQLARLIAAWQRQEGQPVRTAFYHAGMNREERTDIQQRFASGDLLILTATSAFGMGVDIPDIRFVIHDLIPADLTDYAQQSGRAGRDGEPSDCIQLLDLRAIESIRRRYQRDHNQLPQGHSIKKRLQRFRQRRVIRERWRKHEAVLSLFLGGDCIPAGLSRHFGMRAARCGLCDRCRRMEETWRSDPLAAVPRLDRMKEWELRHWALAWQREALSGAEGLSPNRIVSREELTRIARLGVIPADTSLGTRFRPAFERILERLAREQYQTDLTD